jgi:membrane protein YdbS with pleckstrin-like domain
LSDLTTEGISALKTGNKVRARNFLKLAIQENPKNIKAWLWLSGAVEDDDERMMCLLTVLKLEPDNEAATRGLSEIMARRAVAVSPPPAAAESAPPSTPLQEAAPAAVDGGVEMYEDAGVEAAAFSSDTEAEESAAALFEAPFDAEPVDFESRLSSPAAGGWVPAEPEPETEAVSFLAEVVEAPGEAPVEESTQEIPVEKPKEKLIFNLGPSWGYGLGILILLLVVISAIVVAAFVFMPEWTVLIAAALALLWMLIAAGQLLTAASNRYFLTNKHLVIDRGLIGRKRTAIPLASLNEVQLRQGLLQKVLGVGDIALTQEGEPHNARLRNVAKPKVRQDEIQTAWHPASNET